MPKKNIPGYLKHPSGQAYCRLNGKFIYLGRYNSKSSRERYEEVIAEYLANGKKLPPTKQQEEINIAELAIEFLAYAEGYYIDEQGKPTDTLAHCRLAVAPVVKHYGNNAVSDFTPLALIFIRDKWIEAGIARKTINRWVTIIRQMFRWGVIYKFVTTNTLHDLLAVPQLKKGRTKAPEYEEVQPVAPEIVARTLPHLNPVVADMIRTQALTGMRPQDVRNLRICDINTAEAVWSYKPRTHKTKHRGKPRVLAIGPKAQNILVPYMLEKQDTPEAYLFSPADSENARKLEMREKRKSKITPSQQQRNANRKKNPQRKFNEQFTKNSYSRAVRRACQKAGTITTITGLSENTEYEFQIRPVTEEKPIAWSTSIFITTAEATTKQKRPRKASRSFRSPSQTTDSITLTWTYIKEATEYEIRYRAIDKTAWLLITVPKFPEWHPHQLRHATAQAVRDQWGPEFCQAVMGHTNIDTVAIYAHANFEKAKTVMAEIG